MRVSAHLKIDLADYDHRIRTFIPYYDEMLDAAASAVGTLGRADLVVLDLGIGTGALAARCLSVAPRAHLLGIDADDEILMRAQRRLRKAASLELIHGDFRTLPLPRCDAVVASLALHHVPTKRLKTRLYARCFSALRRGGVFVNADCCLATSPRLAALEREAWRRHLGRSYGRKRALGFFRAWSREDVYFRLEDELAMLRSVGFSVDVLWRRPAFAVVLGCKADTRSPQRLAS